MPNRPIRIVTQGPSEPVRVVTQGIADPVRIISGTPSDPVRIVTSGISTPIRIMDDPIGDGLRADAVAYWKMDEISGTRVDATGRGNSAVESGGIVIAESGKTSNAAKIESINNPAILNVASGTDVDFNNTDYTLAMWVRNRGVPIPTHTEVVFVTRYDYDYGRVDFQVYISDIGHFITFSRVVATLLATTFGVAETDDWFWIFVDHVFATKEYRLSINNGPFDTFTAVADPPIPAVPTSLEFGSDGIFPGGFGDTFDVNVDDTGIWHRTLTQDERAYLWNNGAGRALFL